MSDGVRPAGSAGPNTRAFRRFRSHRGAVAGAIVLSAVVLAALLAPWLAPLDPNLTDVRGQFQPPSPDHWLGTDRIGRDLFSRLLYAGRVSLAVGLAAGFVAASVGLVVGLISGYVGGRVDALIMRITDVVLAIPSLIAIVIVVGILGSGVEVVIVVFGLLGWTEAARVVRGVVLSLRQQEFVTSARAIGADGLWIVRRHLLLHVVGPLTVTATFAMAGALLTEAALSYLGLGVRPPQASWGNMLFDAQQLFVLRDMPWYWIPPGAAIFVTVLAVGLVGDGLRDAFDTRELVRAG